MSRVTGRAVRELPANGVLRRERNARVTLLPGVTAVRDAGAPGFAGVCLMNGRRLCCGTTHGAFGVYPLEDVRVLERVVWIMEGGEVLN
jgi:hypothetical protein